MAEKKTTSTVKAEVPADLWTRARSQAMLRGLQVPDLVREALELWLAAPPPPPREDGR